MNTEEKLQDLIAQFEAGFKQGVDGWTMQRMFVWQKDLAVTLKELLVEINNTNIK